MANFVCLLAGDPVKTGLEVEQTYKIIGGDGREYGPVSLLELKDWIIAGRVAALTQVWSSASDQWYPALQYSELHPEIGQIAELTARSQLASAPLVGFWPRAGAYLVDSIVLYLLFYFVLGPFRMDSPALDPRTLPDLAELWKTLGPRLGLEALLTMVYTVIMTGHLGATVGKLLIGARIIKTDGSRIGFGTALVRWLASVLSGLTLGIGYLMIAFRQDKRGLHDLLAGTQVVYRR